MWWFYYYSSAIMVATQAIGMCYHFVYSYLSLQNYIQTDQLFLFLYICYRFNKCLSKWVCEYMCFISILVFFINAFPPFPHTFSCILNNEKFTVFCNSPRSKFQRLNNNRQRGKRALYSSYNNNINGEFFEASWYKQNIK